MRLLQEKLAFVILSLILLTACGPGVSQPLPTAPPITLPPTWTPSPVATALPTFTDIPTFTPVPAFTPIPTPTRDSVAALSELFQDSLFAPNGRWTAYREPDKLLLVNNDDPMHTWTLPCALFDECSTIYPIKWSRNSQELYFAPAPTVGGAPKGITQVTALAVIDVRSGRWEIVLPDSSRHYDFTFSPDNEYIAYTQSSGSSSEEPTVTLGLLRLKNKRVEQQYTLKGAYGGNFVWSPFRPRFVFVINDPQEGSAVGYYDINASFLKYALEVVPADILLSEWGQDNLVSLEIRDWTTNSRSYRVLNPFSGDLIGTSITATPTD